MSKAPSVRPPSREPSELTDARNSSSSGTAPALRGGAVSSSGNGCAHSGDAALNDAALNPDAPNGEAKKSLPSPLPASVAPAESPPRGLNAPFALHVARRLADDVRGTRPKLLTVQLLTSLVPRMSFGWVRPGLYRIAGVRIGAKTRIYGQVTVEGVGGIVSNITIGASCLLTTPLHLNASDEIRIGDRVTIGHHVVIITDNHRMDDPKNRGGERYSAPVVIEDGVWIGACVTILPGVTIGRGSVVAAGALVNADVAPNTVVGGVPAKWIKDLGT